MTRCVTPEQQMAAVRAVCRRRGLAGDDLGTPSNDGMRRTAKKRLLLQKLEESQRAQGRAPTFLASY